MRILAIACILLPSCAGSFLGFTPSQRFRLYEGAAMALGKPELIPAIELIGREITAKNPVKVQ